MLMPRLLSAIAKENGWEMYIDHTADPKGYVLRFQFLIQDYSSTLKPSVQAPMFIARPYNLVKENNSTKNPYGDGL